MVGLAETTLDFEVEVLVAIQEVTSVRLERLSRRLKQADVRAAQEFADSFADLHRDDSSS